VADLGTYDAASEITSTSAPTAVALVFTLDLHHGMLLAFIALQNVVQKISKVL
jgi:hypothetical protein